MCFQVHQKKLRRLSPFLICLFIMLLFNGWIWSVEAQTASRRGEIVVTNAADDGVGTLREALSTLPADTPITITFDATVFPPTSPTTILLQEPLPDITTDNLTIDGSDAGIILDGSNIPSGQALACLVINGTDHVMIQGLQLLNCKPADGIALINATNTIIGGDRLIGSAPLGQGNLISNNRNGISLYESANGNQILGNYIGTDSEGMVAFGNTQSGIQVINAASNNLIGGDTAGTQNLISGNQLNGISLLGSGNIIRGNTIGLNSSGTSKIGNGAAGILISLGANNNVLGGQTSEARNVISGNDSSGILVTSNNNQIIGNYIGTDSTGSKALGNGSLGVFLSQGATDNLIGGTAVDRNIISGNSGGGILLQGAEENQIRGNYIGTDVSGRIALGNGHVGVAMNLGASHNIIGGTLDGEGNVISANGSDGILIQSQGTTDNQVLGNYIGTDASGTKSLGNHGAGVKIDGGASQNVIGGKSKSLSMGNLISGNDAQGTLITSGVTAQSNANQIIGNRIGTDKEGSNPLPNNIGLEINRQATENTIEGNQVSFNYSAALIIEDSTANLIQDNHFEAPLYGGLENEWVPGNLLLNNTFTKIDFIEVQGDSLTEDQTWTKQGELDTYLVVEDDLLIAAGQTLTIAPGVNVLFDFGLGLQVEGSLIAQGTDEQPIRFTTAQRFAKPLFGDWDGISFAAQSSASLEHVTVEFAQNGLTLNGGEVEVISSTITASQADGILVQGGSLMLEDNNLAGNQRFAIENLTDTPIDATGTWWGSASGPLYANNLQGEGDQISGLINVEPWQTVPREANQWLNAPILNVGNHSFTIDSQQDTDWFRLPIGRNVTLMLSLTMPTQDYDIFLFNGLEESTSRLDDIGIGEPQGAGDIKEIGRALCSSRYIGQVASLGRANTSRLLGTTCNDTRVDNQNQFLTESLKIESWDQSGWYYLLVAGHNGANDPAIAYSLQISLTEGTSGEPDFEPPNFSPPTEIQAGKNTMILTHQDRLIADYGVERTEGLMGKLDELKDHPAVAGEIIDLASNQYYQFDSLYQDWDDHLMDTLYANHVAASIKALLTTIKGAYPELEHILIVGNDDIIPFRRIPDEVPIANESSYPLAHESALAASMKEGYFLSDDYYATFYPIPYRGRGLNLPELALGRLVETPEEMMTAIDTFLESPVITATTGLVTGYDFLLDQGKAIAEEMTDGGLTVKPLISNSWTADQLKASWLNQRQEIASINAHFKHWELLPATTSAGNLSATDVRASDNLTGTLVFSVGCHAGLPVAGNDSSLNQLDFAQVLVGKGVTYLANTGFGYGDAQAIGYSEHLMQLFSRHLRQNSANEEGLSLAQLLRDAKSEYFNTLGIDGMSPYDEKVLAVATFYGLPMQKIDLPTQKREVEKETPVQREISQLSVPSSCPAGLSCGEETITPTYITSTVNGSYWSVIGEEPQVTPQQPILPRTSLSLLDSAITHTLELTVARGALFEEGHYQTFEHFDPVVTSIITENSSHSKGEPIYFVEDAWLPAEWDLINSVRTPDGIRQRLVVIPAQYRSQGLMTGTARRFSDMRYTIYYSNTHDTIRPTIWQVQSQPKQKTIEIAVEVTDFSGIVRTVATYTTGDGEWQSIDLTQHATDMDIWQGSLPQQPTLEYFIQAVDSGGNVAIHNNKGRYFPEAPEVTATLELYLPLIGR